MTMAITRVLLVRVAGQTVRTSARRRGPNRAAASDGARHGGPRASVHARRQDVPAARPRRHARTRSAAAAPTIQPVLIANLSRRRIAVAVDEIVNSRDAVVKKLGTHLKRVPGIWGATLLGDGTVVLILNPADSSSAPPTNRSPSVNRCAARRNTRRTTCSSSTTR